MIRHNYKANDPHPLPFLRMDWVKACYNPGMLKKLIPVAVVIWILTLLVTLIFRGQDWANIVLLVVSIGMIALGIVAARQEKKD